MRLAQPRELVRGAVVLGLDAFGLRGRVGLGGAQPLGLAGRGPGPLALARQLGPRLGLRGAHAGQLLALALAHPLELLAQALGLAGERVRALRVRRGGGLDGAEALLRLSRPGAQLARLLLVARAEAPQLGAGVREVALELLPALAGGPQDGLAARLGRRDRTAFGSAVFGSAAFGSPNFGFAPATVASDCSVSALRRLRARLAPPGRRQVDRERADLELRLADVVVRALPREGGDPHRALVRVPRLVLEQREQAPAPARDLDGQHGAHEAAAADAEPATLDLEPIVL